MTTVDEEGPPSVRGLVGKPPEASAGAQRWARRVVSPLEAFMHVEASSGLVLLAAATVALIVANSSLAAGFHHLLETPIGIRVGPWAVERSIHFIVNDVLMTIFFFVVGLEIRREIHDGELSTRDRAILPLAAALGGMLAPALLYLLIAGGTPEDHAGWGVPIATDIAFALGVLALLGKRVPPAMRVLLLALAIIDDIGGIIVIAMFYSGPIDLGAMPTALAGVLGIFVFQRLGVRRAWLYLVPSIFVWLGVYRSGVHPAASGVLIGLLTPPRSWIGATGLVAVVRRTAERVEHELSTGEIGVVAPERLAKEASKIDLARREALPPGTRLQMKLHPWVAFLIMPLFALANAGVALGGDTSLSRVGLGIVVGLVVGKPLGILVACGIVLRLGLATAPRGVGGRALLVLGTVAGIGFTMSLFIADLAFGTPAKLDQAKAAILAASALAMVLSLIFGRVLLRRPAAGESSAVRGDASATDPADA